MNQEKITNLCASTMRELVDCTKESLQCIETMGILIEEWDAIIVFIIQTKMHIDTRTEWEKHLGASPRIPRYSELIAFLEMQFRVLDTAENSPENLTQKSSIKYRPSVNASAITTKTNYQNRNTCVACNDSHYVFFCPMFESWPVTERKKFVAENHLCPVCFHKHDEPCRSKYRCRVCSIIQNYTSTRSNQHPLEYTQSLYQKHQ